MKKIFLLAASVAIFMALIIMAASLPASGAKPGKGSAGKAQALSGDSISVAVSFMASTEAKGPAAKPGKEVVKIEKGTELKSGDQIKIYFSADRDCYVYIFQYGSTGLASAIFPNPAIGMSNHVTGGKGYYIPPGGQWFYLDNNTGKESLYLVASLKPLKDMDKLVSQLESDPAKRKDVSKSLEGQLDQIFKTRALGDALPPIDSTGTAGYHERSLGGVMSGDSVSSLPDLPLEGAVRDAGVTVLKGKGVVAQQVEFEHK